MSLFAHPGGHPQCRWVAAVLDGQPKGTLLPQLVGAGGKGITTHCVHRKNVDVNPAHQHTHAYMHTLIIIHTHSHTHTHTHTPQRDKEGIGELSVN